MAKVELRISLPIGREMTVPLLAKLGSDDGVPKRQCRQG